MCLMLHGLATPCYSESTGKSISYPVFSLIYEYDFQLWLYESKSQKSNKIAVGTGASLSPCKSKIAYAYNHMMPYHNPSKADLIGIHVIDIKTWRERKLECKRYGFRHSSPPCETLWSPDGRYILVDSGTGTEREKTVFYSENGKEKVSFYADDCCAWLNCREIVYTILLEIKDQRRGFEYNFGIGVIDIDGRKRILKDGAPEKNYRFIEYVDNRKIFYEQWSPKSGVDEKTSFWTMDAKGKNLKKADETVTLSGKIRKSLTALYNSSKTLSIRNASYINKGSDWAIFVLNKESISRRADEICIMRLSKPGSIKKIVDGENLLVLERH
ncbi:MAG: hypothetical protein AB2L14_16940 [Candidatus Xenobiia bacterium LiM19]